ncbi:Mediator of RNA polymerase II transcription subunit 27 [Acorus gramineus]|uniref:Mediator of RNA polymerase II transcription subunit 27 n=1 Tax=Acorus gramineus TaxID=55184 RepID=A0AAV9BRM6_ACOGR|nr:Mediator of RNA polymerase II transcription subunit 27 [Acorus gramineus]
MLQQQPLQTPVAATPPPDAAETEDAPPKQVALAMERLTRAGRLIADVRLGADRLLEALFVAAAPHQTSSKSLQLVMKEESLMSQHLQDLRSVGRQLEESGVLSGSMRSRGNSWGLHMPLVCPDGAVVAYAWKRQLAGQAGASAVDRTRLALKAFTDQKKRFFPHLEDELFEPSVGGEFRPSKKHCGPRTLALTNKSELVEDRTLSDVLMHMEKEAPTIKISTHQRLDWLKRACSLSVSSDGDPMESSKGQTIHNSDNLKLGSSGIIAMDQIAIIELTSPSVFRAILSLHPAGSTTPDAVAFFSPDEGGNYMHARGFSVYRVYRLLTEHANKALQYLLSAKPDASLRLLLLWICSYQTLFSKACSKCGRLLSMDKPSVLFLPPIQRPYRQSFLTKVLQSSSSPKEQCSDLDTAYHIGCSSDEPI